MSKFEGNTLPPWEKAVGSKPSFSGSVMFDKKTGLYLPIFKFDKESAVGYTNASFDTTRVPRYTGPWDLGVFCMLKDLMGAGLCNMRLAELMYTASRVFEHNLATRARQHGMRVRDD